MTLTKEEEVRAKKLLEREKARYKYLNDYNKKNYDRLSVVMPKGCKERLKAVGISNINGFIKDMLMMELERLEAEQGVTPADDANENDPF